MSAVVKSDNPTRIGQHVFAASGLGQAPFRVIGFERRVFRVAPDAPAQPAGSCQYCGTPIADCCLIRSADGRTFVVGTTCVDKTGDSGLIQAYRRTVEYRSHQRELRIAKDAHVVAEWEGLTADPVARGILDATMIQRWDGMGEESWLAYATRVWGWCGMAGHARYLRQAKKIIAKATEGRSA